jgi:hypothetical protein
MPAAYTGPIPHLRRSARIKAAKLQPSLALRLRVRWNAAQLDAALADGADPHASEALALRAHQLADPRHRTRIAKSIRNLLDVAGRGAAAYLSVTRAPLSPDRVENSRARLTELAERLEAVDAPPTQGLAMANLLVEDGTGTMYAHEPSDPIRPAVDAVLATLQR